MSHKAPLGSMDVATISLSQMEKATHGPGNESVGQAQGVPGAGASIVFPAIEPESAPTAVVKMFQYRHQISNLSNFQCLCNTWVSIGSVTIQSCSLVDWPPYSFNSWM